MSNVGGPFSGVGVGGSGGGFKRFELGEDYAKDTIVVYEEGFYEAKVDITAAAEVPPLAPDQWDPFYAHGIESFGDTIEDEPGAINFASADIEATAQEGTLRFATVDLDAGDEIHGRFNTAHFGSGLQINKNSSHTHNADLASLGGFPSARASIVSHQIESHEDGLVLEIPFADSFGIRLDVEHSSSPQSLPTVTVALELQVGSGGWSIIRQGSRTLTGSAPHDVDMNLTANVTTFFTLNDGERAAFRWIISVANNVGERYIRGVQVVPHSDSRLNLRARSTSYTEDAEVNSLSHIPSDILTFDSDGRLQPETAGITYTFPADVDMPVRLNVASKGFGSLTAAITLQAKEVGDVDWTDVKSGSATIADAGNHDITLSGANDVSFGPLTLADSNELEFRFTVAATGSYYGGGSILLLSQNHLVVQLAGVPDLHVGAYVTGLADVPEALATSANGYIRSRVDDFEFVIPADDDFRVRFQLDSGARAPQGETDLRVRFELQAKLATDATWTTVKDHDLHTSHLNSINHDFDLSSGSDESFTLNEGDELEFRYEYHVVAGSIVGGSIAPLGSNRLITAGTAQRGHHHLLVHGTGEDNGKIVVKDIAPEHTVTTPLIDVEAGAEYVGPTKLAGLSGDLDDIEKDTIQEKVGVVRMRPFLLGGDYALGTAVEYGNSWYRAMVDVEDAQEVPPHDLTRWVEFFSHGIEGYNELVEDQLGDVAFAKATLEEVSHEALIRFPLASLEISDNVQGEVSDRSLGNTTLHVGGGLFLGGAFTGLGSYPSAKATVSGNNLRANQDGLTLVIPATEDLGITLDVDSITNSPQVRVVLQTRINSGTWTNAIEATKTLTSTDGVDYDLSNSSDLTFSLDNNDTLGLRWALQVHAGAGSPSIRGGEIRIRSGERLVLRDTEAVADTHEANVNSLSHVSSDVLTYDSNGHLQPETAGITYVFPSELNLPVRLHIGSKGSSDLAVAIKLQGKQVGDASWTDVKSATATISTTGNHDIQLTNANDVSFGPLDLTDSNELEFRWDYSISGDYYTDFSVHLLSQNHLIVQFTGAPHSYVAFHVNGLTNVPELLATIDEGNIRARVDDLEIVVLHTSAFPTRLIATDTTVPAGSYPNVHINVQLQAKLTTDSTWQVIKSHTGDLANSGADATNDFNATASSSTTFTLDEGNELEFRWEYWVTAGRIAGGTIGQQPGKRLRIESTGAIGHLHLLRHGTGTDAGKILVIDHTTNTTTTIIDIDDGAEYIGPTKLAGLASGLLATEQAAIRTKLDVPAMSDLTGATFITAANTAVTSNAYALTTGDSLTEYVTGKEFIFVAEADSDGDVTVNIDGIGAKELHGPSGQLGDGDIDDGDILRIVYNGDEFLHFETGDPNASEVLTTTTNFDGLLDSDPTTVQSALNILDDIDAEDLPTDTSDFDGILGSNDDNIQDALETIDDIDARDVPTRTNNFDGLLGDDEDTVQKALNVLDDVDAGDIPMPTGNLDGVLDSGDNTVRQALQTLDDLDATDIPVDTGNFNKVLSSSDDDVQRALDTINDLNAGDVPVAVSTWDNLLADAVSSNDVQDALDAIDNLDIVKASGSNSVKTGMVAGSGNTVVMLSPNPAITQYVDGLRYVFVSPITNTGPVTVHVSGLGSQALRTADGLLTGGELQTNSKYLIIYDTNGFLLVNPSVDAELVPVDASSSDGFLDGNDDNLQDVADRLDALNADNLPGNEDLRIHVLSASDVGGTANAITLSPSPAIDAYELGQAFIFPVQHNSTGTVTISVSGLAALQLRSADGVSTLSGPLRQNDFHLVVVGQANFLLINRDHLPADNITIDADDFDGVLDSTVTDVQELANQVDAIEAAAVNASKADADLGNLDSALTDDEQEEIGEKLRIPLLGPYVATDDDEDSEELADWDDGTPFHGTHDSVVAIAINPENDELASADVVDDDYRTKPDGGLWSTPTDMPSGEGTVGGIDYDADGNIHIVGEQTGAVWRRGSGSWTKVFDLDSANGTPVGLAINKTTGDFFVADRVDDLIYYYEADGTYDSDGNVDIGDQGIEPYDIAFDQNDNLLIVDGGPHTIHIYRWDGTPGSSGGAFGSPVDPPSGVSTDFLNANVACWSNRDLVLGNPTDTDYYTREVTGWNWAVQASPELDEYREGVTIWATFPGAIALDGNPPDEELPVDLSVDGLDPVPVNGRNGRLRLYDLHEGVRYPLVYEDEQFTIDLVDQLEITDFALGDEYRNNRITRYQRVLYQATQEIDHASEIPPLDPDNWSEFSTHGIQGYGEVEDETRGTFLINPVAALPNQAADDTIARRTLFLRNPVDIPQGIVTIEDGYFQARVDGTVLLFDADDDMLIRFWAYTPSSTTLDIDIEASTDNANWSTLKSFTGTLAASASVVLSNLTLSSTTDSSFTLDEDDELRLRIVIDVTAGEIQSPIVGAPAADDDPWAVKVTGVRETRHILAHGTGATDGNIVVENSTDGTIIPLIDIDDGAEYIGPTKLAGLDGDLTQSEQAAIQTKLDLAILGSTIRAKTFTVKSALSETDDEIRHASGNNITEIQVSVDNDDAEVRTAQALLFYTGESAGWNDLEGEFRVHSVSVTDYANIEGETITFTGELTRSSMIDDLNPFTFGAVDDTIRIVFVAGRPVTAYVPHQVGTDEHHHLIGYNSAGNVGIVDGNNVPTTLDGLADDLTTAEQNAILAKLGITPRVCFDLPRNYVVPLGLHISADENPSSWVLPASTLLLSPVELHGPGDGQFGLLGELTSTNAAGGGSLRVTLYTWDDATSLWTSASTALVDDLTGFSQSDYMILDWLTLPSAYASYDVEGYALLGLQGSAGNLIQPAVKNVNPALDPAISAGFMVTSSGTTHVASFAHPSSGFTTRHAHVAYRRPPAA